VQDNFRVIFEIQATKIAQNFYACVEKSFFKFEV